jgi:hypothetical protein
MADEQDKAEAVDADVLDDEFPPDDPQGVDDPTQDDRVEDDVVTRDLREEPDFVEREEAADDRPLIQPYVDERDAILDVEKDLVAEAEPGRDPEADGAPPAAEEAALHLELEPDIGA